MIDPMIKNIALSCVMFLILYSSLNSNRSFERKLLKIVNTKKKKIVYYSFDVPKIFFRKGIFISDNTQQSRFICSSNYAIFGLWFQFKIKLNHLTVYKLKHYYQNSP